MQHRCGHGDLHPAYTPWVGADVQGQGAEILGRGGVCSGVCLCVVVRCAGTETLDSVRNTARAFSVNVSHTRDRAPRGKQRGPFGGAPPHCNFTIENLDVTLTSAILGP